MQVERKFEENSGGMNEAFDDNQLLRVFLNRI
jgi:hypothetical protein